MSSSQPHKVGNSILLILPRRNRERGIPYLAQLRGATRGRGRDSSPGGMDSESNGGSHSADVVRLKEILCIRFSAERLTHGECSARSVAVTTVVLHSSP